MKLTRRSLCGAGLAMGVWPLAYGQDGYPNRPVKLLVPFAPGGVTDALARKIAQGLQGALSQPIVVDNKPGAGTLVAAGQLANAAADGYTLLMASSVTMGSAPVLTPSAGFKPADATPVALLGYFVMVLVTRSDFPAQDFKALIEQLKSKPSIQYSSPGVGTPPHLLMEMLKAKAGLKIDHVPYNSSPQILTDMLSGNGPALAFIDPVIASAQIRAGKLRAYAVTGQQGSPVAPGAPPMTTFYPDLDLQAWTSIVAPARTPEDVLVRLNRASNALTGAREFQAWMLENGIVPHQLALPELRTFIARESLRWGDIAKAAVKPS